MTLTYGRAVAVPFLQGTPEWERERLRYIGSSSIPIITGNSPYKTSAVQLWAHMAGVLEPDPIDPETQELFDLGHKLEPIVAWRYTLKTGRPLRKVKRMLVSRDIPWAACSLDRVSAVRGERLIVECKWSPYRDFAGEGGDLVPAHVVDQVQWQMLVTGYPLAHVAVIVGSRFSWFEIPEDKAHQSDLLYLGEDFMGYVIRKERPPVDGSDATRRVLTRMHTGSAVEWADADALSDAFAAELREATKVAKWATDRQELVKNQVRALLKDAEADGVEQPGRYTITWKADKNGSRSLRPRFVDEEVGSWH